MLRRILVVDDDPAVRRSLEFALADSGLQVRLAATAGEGLETFKREEPSVVVLDLFLPDRHGLELLREFREHDANVSVIVVTASDRLRDAVDAMKLGAMEYLVKPYDVEALKLLIQHAIRGRRTMMELGAQRKAQSGRYSFEALESRNTAMRRVVELAKKLAQNPTVTILIEGETGVGKEFLARAIHNASPRANGPFTAISCAAIPETLLESELFGHEAGAFTDARSRKSGLFELAEEGSLFLDEVGEMSQAVQVKLLRAIETKAFRRVGGTEDLTVDTRIIAATNTDLEKAVREKRVREDLYYRLKVGPLTIPPLRARPEDILDLSRRLLGEVCRDLKRQPLELAPAVEQAFLGYRWPGNIRELRNVIERAVILQGNGGSLELENLPPEIRTPAGAAAGSSTLAGMEREFILRVLKECGGHPTRAAKALGISRTTLYEKLKLYGIAKPKA